MNSTLVDTTVWVDYLNGVKTWQTDLLEECIRLDRNVVITPTIVQEVLQGIREDSFYKKVKNSLLGFGLLIWSPLEAAIQAAEIYRVLRKKGITIRKANDCLIAAFALHFSIELLHADKDFDKIQENFPLKILVR